MIPRSSDAMVQSPIPGGPSPGRLGPAWRLAFALALSGGLGCVLSPAGPEAVVELAPAPDPEALRAAREAAFHVSAVNWKERLAQGYVYLEGTGDYRGSGAIMRDLFALAEAAELEPTGPPFALFYDDPRHTPVDELRMRACLPIEPGTDCPRGLLNDVLPRELVVYARVRGAYPDVPRSYGALFQYAADHGWKAGGPVREVYLVDPGSAQGPDELETEVQLPWSAF